MKAEQTALFTDLDGTLFNSRGEVSQENRAAIEHYMAEGGVFAISTGRAPYNALRFIGDLPTNAPSVVYNGAGIYHFATGEYGFVKHLEPEKTFPLFRWTMDNIPGANVQLYTDTQILYCTPLEKAQPEFLEIHQPCRYAALDTLRDTPIVKALILAEERYMDALGEMLKAHAEGSYDLKLGAVILGERISYYELMPPEATKGAALRTLRTHPLVAGRTILAAGDYWNDYELLQEADVPVAPGNAIDEIKALCRFTTVSNDGHAIKHIIEDIIPAL
ncbi:MAG: HAD hydrolase family protein [Oscillospiraceae bacterium]|nr:HAD hydrolase family protein [Oscillospiraceae bacterium]